MSDERKYIADVVGDDYKEWNNEKIIFDAGTGTGKTTFCLDILGRYAEERGKSILYLCNRSPLKNEKNTIVEERILQNVITVQTYQAIECLLENGENVDYYDYVVADEAHYFMADSQFNYRTTLSYRYILSLQDCVVIFASGTAKRFFKSLDGKRYHIPNKYEYVEKLIQYNSGQLVPMLKGILENKPGEKAIVFLNNAKRMIEMHEIFSEQTFYCSASTRNRELKKICTTDSPIVDGRLKNSRILFTTKVLDNGIDVRDDNVRYMFSELVDMDSLIQSLGRWRKPEDSSRVTFCVRDYKKEEINRYLNMAKEHYKKIKEFRSDPELFRIKYRNDGKFTLKYPQFNQYSGKEIEVDEASAEKLYDSIILYKKVMESSWIDVLLQEMDELEVLKERVTYSEYESETKKHNKEVLRTYLKTIEGQRIYIDSPEMQKTKDMIEHYGELTVKAKRLKHPIKTWNGLLDDLYGNHYGGRFSAQGERDMCRRLPDGRTNPYFKKTYYVFSDQRSK